MEQKVKPVPIAVGETVIFKAGAKRSYGNHPKRYNHYVVGVVKKVNRVNMVIVRDSPWDGQEWTVRKNIVRRYRDEE